MLILKHLPEGKESAGFSPGIKVLVGVTVWHSPSDLPAPVGAPSSCDLPEAGGHVQPPQGPPLERLALVTRGAYISGPHVYEGILKTVGGLPPPGHSTNTRLKHTPSLPVKRPIYLSCSFSLRGRFQVDLIA